METSGNFQRVDPDATQKRKLGSNFSNPKFFRREMTHLKPLVAPDYLMQKLMYQKTILFITSSSFYTQNLRLFIRYN